MDSLNDNVTLRKKGKKSVSYNDITNVDMNTSASNSLFDTTIHSLQDASFYERRDSNDESQSRIMQLEAELEVANQEIENLNSENCNLKTELGRCRKLIDLYKKMSVENTTLTPKSKKKKDINMEPIASTSTVLDLTDSIGLTPENNLVGPVNNEFVEYNSEENKIQMDSQVEIANTGDMDEPIEQKIESHLEIIDNDSLREPTSDKMKRNNDNVTSLSAINVSRILILGDEQGRNVALTLQKLLGKKLHSQKFY